MHRNGPHQQVRRQPVLLVRAQFQYWGQVFYTYRPLFHLLTPTSTLRLRHPTPSLRYGSSSVRWNMPQKVAEQCGTEWGCRRVAEGCGVEWECGWVVDSVATSSALSWWADEPSHFFGWPCWATGSQLWAAQGSSSWYLTSKNGKRWCWWLSWVSYRLFSSADYY